MVCEAKVRRRVVVFLICKLCIAAIEKLIIISIVGLLIRGDPLLARTQGRVLVIRKEKAYEIENFQ